MRTGFRTKTLLGIFLLFGVFPSPASAQTQKAIVRERADAEVGPQEPYLRVKTEGHAAEVRALCFAGPERLCTAGFDKLVHVWRRHDDGELLATKKAIVRERSSVRNPAAGWARERTILWEAGPGPRGQIFTMATSSDGGQVAIAGYGNRGGTGEIIFANPLTGQITAAEYVAQDGGHTSEVAGLAFSANGDWLASHGRNGEVYLRRRNEQPIRLMSAVESRREVAPIAIRGNTHVALPVYAGQRGRTPVWKIQLYNIAARVLETPLPTECFGEITAIAASADGDYLAAADTAYNLHLWDFRRGNTAQRLLTGNSNPKRVVASLAFGPNAQTLIAGTFNTNEVLKLDLKSHAVVQLDQVENPVWACACSPDGTLVAYADGKDVVVRSLAQPGASTRLDGGKGITQVSFAGDAPGYRVTFQKGAADQATFEAKELKMIRAGAAGQEGNAPAGNWALRADPSRHVLQVIREGQVYREIPFDRQTYGIVTTYRWITNEAAQPVKIAVGTEAGTGCLFVFDLTSPATPLVRQFIGHSDRVNSVAVSDDRRYLVTGSADCTIRYWTLEHSDAASPLMRRWGIDAAQRAGRLVVEEISDAGPLFYKGLREGDVITSIAWEAGGETWTVREPNDIKRRLEQLPHSTQVGFHTSRDGLDRQAVQDQSVWKHFLAVFPNEADWIAWSPIGYYACSVGGERLIGWQISNELGEPPSHYEATQFAKTLYQPKLISTLLEAGSLKKARQLVGLQEQSAAISNPSDIRPPRVTIITPTLEPGQGFKKVTAPRIRVTAEAVSEHYPLESLRLLLNGRPYQERHSAKGIARERLSKQASWEFDLPAGRNRLQVLASVDVGEATSGPSLVQGKSDELVIEYDGEKKLPSLYVLAVGISAYPSHPGFRPLALNYARSDAEKFVATVGKYSRALFERVELIPLVDENATTEKILKAFDKIQAQVTPRDIVMVFYSGHGVLADEQFFLLSVDGRPNAITSTCVPEAAIKRFCESTPGRLVLLVDACHSGAFRGEGLVRELVRDDYGVIVMASSRGDEVSLEHPDWKAGAFTKALTEGLQGMADFNGDGYVLNIEVDSYIYNRVFELTDGKQNPVSFKPTTVTPFRVSQTEQRNALGAVGD